MGEFVFWTFVFVLLFCCTTIDRYWLCAIYLMGLLTKLGMDLSGALLIPSLIVAKVVIDIMRK